jgi:Cd2+/Zn2+-exporting ATPase/Cu+-exporting ATPase
MWKADGSSPEINETRMLLSKSERRRFSSDILKAMGALSCLAAARAYGVLNPSQETVGSLIYLAGVLTIGIPVTFTAIKGFLRQELCSSMDILVTLAMIVSVLNGQYIVAIMIPVLLTIVHFFEEKSIVGGKYFIEGLRKMQSDKVIRVTGGIHAEVDARDLVVGDVILVKPGMGFPIDGRVLSGTSSVNQQSLTGETLPKDVEPGACVYAGTLNIQGALTVEVEKAYEDTSFRKIVNMLEEIDGVSTSESRMIDRFMAHYIPLILIIATLVWLFTKQIDRAVAILVVSCPCGYMLVSSAPLIASMAVAAKRGIMIRNACSVEKLIEVESVFLDKTGTLTSGEIAIQQCVTAEGVSEEELFGAAISTAVHSTHPLSKAVMQKQAQYAFEEDFEVTERGGMGLIGEKKGQTILLGNESLLSSFGISVPANLQKTSWEEIPAISVYVAKDGRFMGLLAFHDTIREGAPEAIADLKFMGIKETCLLTGDKLAIAEHIRKVCSIDKIFAEVLPGQKQGIIKHAKALHKTAFVGDGINDALALSEADIGIAMGAIGNDTAIQSADISLMNNRLANIPFLITLARRGREIARQNIAIAFLSSVIFISLAACGFVAALSGAILHNLGAFVVLLNSGRILSGTRAEER